MPGVHGVPLQSNAGGEALARNAQPLPEVTSDREHPLVDSKFEGEALDICLKMYPDYFEKSQQSAENQWLESSRFFVRQVALEI